MTIGESIHEKREEREERDRKSELIIKPVQRDNFLKKLVSALHKKETASTSSLYHASLSPESSNYRILLVEDNPVNQRVTERQLTRLGYNVHVVENGKEALNHIKTYTYNLILMDCQMPVMNGFIATKAIRALEQKRDGDEHIPVIAMTANVAEGDRERCFNAGMDDYLSKPVTQADLTRKLHQWLSPKLLETPHSDDNRSDIYR